MPSIVIPDNQVRVKDCYAPAPNINLTLRSNGEERVMVMDSLGQFMPAGLEAPTVAPIANVVVAPAPGMDNPKWIAYRYVYAATKRYPLVENAVTPGGSLSPRSNPSPSVSANIAVANRGVDLTVTKSIRADIDAIWIFRTDYYDTQAEADQASAEGTLYYVGSIYNDGIAGTIVYQDRTTIVTGGAQIEFDNFMAEQFWLCVYVEPYFYGFANHTFTAPISVTAAGLITLTNVWSPTNLTGDKWYDGRDRQVVTMEGITTGGFDGNGSYYFKWLSNSEAQLYFDPALTILGSTTYTGTTTVTIKGPATNLYRSKINNPLSWGVVNVVDNLNVPAPYVYRVGGGQGTAICVVPVLNLLKVDTEGPNKTYVFNLKAQGTEDFERSKQEISSDYSASNHWSQVTARTAQGQSLIWFLDNKYGVICQSDGSNNIEISSPVCESLKDRSVRSIDRLFTHSAYDPRTQITVVWITSDVGPSLTYSQNDRAFLYHHPSNTWSVLDQKGILCSFPFLDRETNNQMVMVGSDTGRIGRMFAPNTYWNWTINTTYWPQTASQTGFTTFEIVSATDITLGENIIGMWVGFTRFTSSLVLNINRHNNRFLGWARISNVVFVDPPGLLTFTVDKVVTANGGHGVDLSALDFPNGTALAFLEPILCNNCKKLEINNNINFKTIAEVWLSKLSTTYPFRTAYLSPFGNQSSLHGMIHLGFDEPTGGYPNAQTFEFTSEIQKDMQVPPTELKGNNMWAKKFVALDKAKHINVSLFDVGYERAAITNFQYVFKQPK